MKIYVAIAALLTAAPAPPLPDDFPHDEAAIVLVRCFLGTGSISGSAFKVSETAYITAEHVVGQGACFVGTQRITVTSADAKLDYATFDGPASPHTLATTCAGFRPGQVYVARGFPGGGAYNIFAPALASIAGKDGLVPFISTFIPGMSGGPVLDPQGRAVGIVNRHSPARSMPLSNTGFCKS